MMLALFAVLAAPVPEQPLSIAVLDLQAQAGVSQSTAEVLGVLLQDSLRNELGMRVIGRADIETMLGLEKMKDMLACQDKASCMAEIGGALGVDEILTGSIARLGSYLIVSLKRISPSKAQVLAQVTKKLKGGSEDELVEAVGPLLKELYGGVAPGARPDALAAAAERQKAADEAAKRAEQQRKAEEAATLAEEQRRLVQAEAARRAEETKRSEGQRVAEETPQAAESPRFVHVVARAAGTIDAMQAAKGRALDLQAGVQIGVVELGTSYSTPQAYGGMVRIWLPFNLPIHVAPTLRFTLVQRQRGGDIGRQSSPAFAGGIAVDHPLIQGSGGALGVHAEVLVNKGAEMGLTVPLTLAAYWRW